MLDSLDTSLSNEKRKDLLGRLTNKRPEQVLGAEMELAISYGFASNFDTEIEPEWFPGPRKPDLYVDNFFDKSAFVEITAISDEMISDQRVMRTAAQKIVQYVNQLKKGKGKRLYFEFQEKSGYIPTVPPPINSIFGHTEYYRERLVNKDFALCDTFKQKLTSWVNNPEWPNPDAIRVKLDYVDVVIRAKDFDYPSSHNFHSTMPALCYSLEKNPIFKALKAKEKQLKQTPLNNLRVVFLCNAGCRPLGDLYHNDPTNLTKSAKEIIRHYLSKGSKIDHVFIVSPKVIRGQFGDPRRKKVWNVIQFNGLEQDDKNYADGLKKIFSKLPPPRYEGYNAKGLQLQGVFKPNNRDQYLGTKYMSKTANKDEFQIKTSSKALYELMSGQIDYEEFKKVAGDIIEMMNSERRISDLEFEAKGPSEDDDYVTITVKKDPAAAGLT